MRLYTCPRCGTSVVFSNTQCLSCGTLLQFDIAARAFVLHGAPCRNRTEIDCNWISDTGPGGLCLSCAMTETIPDTFAGENRELWAESELAKRRVLANLGRWGWFVPDDTGRRPVFHLLSEASRSGGHDVVMAHSAGAITINVMEADVVERVRRGEVLGEKLRTMVGHFRHEIAHFLFERLAERPGFLDAVRALMGDERADYAQALRRYYAEGPPPGWEAQHITRYASAHPHEDWAETVTHLLHLVDIVDGAVAMGWRSDLLDDPSYDAYAEPDAGRIIERGAYVGMAVNHINRSMGLGDIYPFVLTEGVRGKLAFAHGWLTGHATGQP